MKANSKQLSTKSKTTATPMSLRSSQLSIQNTPKTANKTNNNKELENIRKVGKEELEDHEKKFCEVLKSHLETANQRLNKILDEVVELTKSLEFTQAEVKEEITNIKDNLNQVKTEIQELGEDALDPDYVANKRIDWKIAHDVTTFVLMESKKSSMKHGTDVKKKYRRLSKTS